MPSLQLFLTDPSLAPLDIIPDPTGQTSQSNTAPGYAFASGTVTCAAVAAADTVTINGVVLTAIAATATPTQVQFQLGTGATQGLIDIGTAANLAQTIRNHGLTGGTVQNQSPPSPLPPLTGATSACLSDGVTAQNFGTNVCTITAAFYGTTGNNITLTSSTAVRLLTSGATLTGGATATPVLASGTFTGVTVVAGNTAVVQGVTFTAIAAGIPTAIQFNVASTDAGTMQNLAAAINAHPQVAALVFATYNANAVTNQAVIVVTARQVGTYANTMVLSATGGITAVTMAGGVGYVNPNNNSRMRDNLHRIHNYLLAMAGGSGDVGTGVPSGGGVGGSVLNISIGSGTTGFVFATGTLTVAAPAGGATCAINGVTFTGGAGTTGDLQFNTTGTNIQIAQSIADAINKTTNAGIVGIATASTGGTAVVTVSASVPGRIGNAISLAGTAVTLVASGAALTGGTGGERPTVNYAQ